MSDEVSASTESAVGKSTEPQQLSAGVTSMPAVSPTEVDDAAGPADASAQRAEPSQTSDKPPASYTVHPRRGGRGRQTVRDMVFSLSAIGAAVAVILVITHRPDPDPVRVVQAAPVIVNMQAMVTWPVVNPVSQLRGWRVTSARIEPTTTLSGGPVLSLGFVTPSGQWLGVKQAGVPVGQRAQAWLKQVQQSAGDVSSTTLRGNQRSSFVIYGTASVDERRALLAAMNIRP